MDRPTKTARQLLETKRSEVTGVLRICTQNNYFPIHAGNRRSIVIGQ